VGSAEEAAGAVDAGCDYVVVQGTEPGGHVRGMQPLDDVLAGTKTIRDGLVFVTYELVREA
jgi:NAD(P)H-dependent flavin oxidoreductase YrpB (nitropropane dioxygenase family)